MTTTPEEETRDRLLKAVKKEVKCIMEEAVTRKFVHEESSSIIALCGAVEACLLCGLKKRSLGLFKNSTTTALLHKVSKSFDPAAQIVKIINEIENNNDTPNDLLFIRRSLDNNKNLSSNKKAGSRYLWIRQALFEKQLAKIIDYLVNNSSKYYEKDALVADPCDGPILASLLVGPCALDYTKMKTTDHYWTDPPADELVQRHRIHSGTHHVRSDSPKRPGLQIRRNTSSSSEESMRATPMSAKEYVESLHQNSRTTLLYGKNNVMVQPKEDVEKLAGYLSLHQGTEGLSVKWTPNQLMNGCCEGQDEDVDRSLYWDYAVTVYLDEIVYLHCHQQPDSGGTIVLVGQDGVQRPPIHFPRGGHLLAFLSCLENGLLPHGQLDPPLWSQRGKGKVFPKLRRKGSRMSKDGTKSPVHNRSVSSLQSMGSSGSSNLSVQMSEDSTCVPGDENMISGTEEEEATDYVFRIITTFKPENMPAEMLDPKAKDSNGSGGGAKFPWSRKELSRGRSGSGGSVGGSPRRIVTKPPPPPSHTVHTVQTTSSSGRVQDDQGASVLSKTEHRIVVRQLCDTMKKQIISRAFYGWLAHCRHLKTVRTHLSGLVNQSIIPVNDPSDASVGLTPELWREMSASGVVTKKKELFRLVYYGGVSHEIRAEVWPYLLRHYDFGSKPEDREALDQEQRQQYEKTMSEWLAVEAIVRQRDKEVMAANLAKLSQESQDGHIPLVRKESSLSNDVFESVDSEDCSHPETLREESSNTTTPTKCGKQTTAPEASTSDTTVTREVGSSNAQAQQETETGSHEDRVTSTGSKETTSPDEGLGGSIAHTCSLSDSRRSDSCDTEGNAEALKSESDDTTLSPRSAHATDHHGIIVTNPSVDSGSGELEEDKTLPTEHEVGRLLSTSEEGDQFLGSRESLVSPAHSNASNGGIYSAELLENVALNLHRIDKDVQRCDRNYHYFSPDNLDKLRNVMCTYVWEHLEVGYVQGMCDLVAPLLVVFDDEAKTYSCFCQLMKRMASNFPHGGAMDTHFANMRSLIQILDAELFEHMHQNGDYTHFYFCYRWFLLDFKRELVYDDVFSVWETIWTARHISSANFVLFIALALVEYYREIILDNNMDFTDIIKFFNEMAERHNAKQVLKIARDLVYKLQDLIENK